jgi:hypothetical protein
LCRTCIVARPVLDLARLTARDQHSVKGMNAHKLSGSTILKLNLAVAVCDGQPFHCTRG